MMIMEFARNQCCSQNFELLGSEVGRKNKTRFVLNWVALFLQKLGDCRSDLHSTTFTVILLYIFPFLVRNNGNCVKKK